MQRVKKLSVVCVGNVLRSPFRLARNDKGMWACEGDPAPSYQVASPGSSGSG